MGLMLMIFQRFPRRGKSYWNSKSSDCGTHQRVGLEDSMERDDLSGTCCPAGHEPGTRSQLVKYLQYYCGQQNNVPPVKTMF